MIELEEVREYLGQQGKRQGDEIVFCCNECRLSGGDYNGDNLKYNLKKHLLYCFADSTHAGNILSEINKRKKMTNQEIPAYIANQEFYVMYQIVCNDMLLGKFDKNLLQGMQQLGMCDEKEVEQLERIAKSDRTEKARTYLKQTRGINTSTIEKVGLGFDFIANKWVIPIYNMQNKLVGFEYRLADFKNKKIWREKGTPSCLAPIYGNGSIAMICEGMLDSFCLVQMLERKGILGNYSIFTTSAGVQAVSKIITELKFNDYKTINLILDNDKAGDEEVKKVIAKYPFIKDGRGFLRKNNCKDINEFMLKII